MNNIRSSRNKFSQSFASEHASPINSSKGSNGDNEIEVKGLRGKAGVVFNHDTGIYNCDFRLKICIEGKYGLRSYHELCSNKYVWESHISFMERVFCQIYVTTTTPALYPIGCFPHMDIASLAMTTTAQTSHDLSASCLQMHASLHADTHLTVLSEATQPLSKDRS